MLPMLVIKIRMNTIKQLSKGDNFAKNPLTFCSFLKIVVQKTLLKAFLVSTYIMPQLRFNHQISHVKKEKNKQHIETQNMLILIPFQSAPSIATYFGTFHAFHQLKKIIHVRFSSMIYATFTQHMFSCYILISPFPQECHGRKMLGKFVIF
jgi:hypothetical protein